MSNPNSIEHRAIAAAKAYFASEGYEVDHVSYRGVGYDLLVRRGAETLKIEVKGSKNLWGIPDPYETEVDENRRLVADYIYMAYFQEGVEPVFCLIPRNAINPEDLSPRRGWRIHGRIKKSSVLSQYIVTKK
ncbi:MAG: hypothetical protein A2Z90_14120 [Burkholderiales bacterium GWA2_64_37]|nr:MAG: hypothetical protein A2Z90_14120 [Burkholderiales bacterium GWA2_64_37]